MTRNLRIAEGLSLPADIVTQAIAILARKGAGKTYTGSVIAEEVIRASIPIVILDPTGAWWGLRSSVNGSQAGLPVVIFGGDHGDVPLEESAGRVIADVVVEHPGAYIVDLSGFPSRRAEQRFAAEFLERLYRAKGRETGPLLLIVDEADTFAPQRPGPEQTRTLGALEAIVRRGRIKGLGDLLITQRAAVLNKNVLTQTEVLVVMQTTGPQDRAAIDAWIEGNGTPAERAEVLGSLASMEQGEAWVWSPSFLRLLRRVRIRARTTYDSSRTPTAGEASIAPRAFAKVDLVKLGARIERSIEQAKANDPATLRARIAELERAAKAPTPVEVRLEVPVVSAEAVRYLEALASNLATLRPTIDAAIEAIERDAAAALLYAASVRSEGFSAPIGEPIPSVASRLIETPRAPRPAVQQSDGALSGYAARLLSTLARHHPLNLTRTELGLLSGSSRRSSSFDGAIAELRRKGLIELADGRYAVTSEGWPIVGGVPATPQTTEERIATWRSALPKAESVIFDVLVGAYPRSLTRTEIAEASSYSPTSSTFDGAISTLRRAGLADGTPAEGLRAAEILFA